MNDLQLYKNRITFLRNSRCNILTHSGTSLLVHLEGTFKILKTWGCSDNTCWAGLFHSIYGTESYKNNCYSVQNPNDRRIVLEATTPDIERLVSLYSKMKFKDFFDDSNKPNCATITCRHTNQKITLTNAEFNSIVHISVANFVEQSPRISQYFENYSAYEIRKLVRYTNPLAMSFCQSFDVLQT